jgi:hypothetical protein
MTVWPLIERELRLRARQPLLYAVRCGIATLATVVAVQSSLAYAGAMGAKIGWATFYAVSWLGFVLACVSALVTADAISSERRDGTLPLLLLTQLTCWELILAKLSAASLTSLCVLASCLPTLGLAVLAGGVTGEAFVRMQLALLNASFVALAAGMWISSRGTHRRKTMRNALLLVLLLQSVPWILVRAFARYGTGSIFFALPSPFSAFYVAANPSPTRLPFWLTLAIPHLIGWLLLAGATARLMRNWRVVEMTEAERPKVIEPVLAEEAAAMRERNVQLRQTDPVCWVVSRLRGHGALLWIGSLFLFLLGGTGFTVESRIVGSWLIPSATGLWNGLNLMLNLGAAALLAWGAGRNFFAARNGELELLLSTPLGASDIVAGHWRALCQPLRGAWMLFALLIFMQFAVLPASAWSHLGLSAFHQLMIPINLVLDIIALCWVGMWFGLKCDKAWAVISWTVGLVIGLPWLVIFLMDLIFSLSGISNWGTGPGAAQLVVWSSVVALLLSGKNVFLIVWAAAHLRSELRARASQGLSDWLR